MAEKYRANKDNTTSVSSPRNNNEKKEDTKDTLKSVGKEVGSKYLEAKGVPAPLADMAADKVAENKNVNKVLDKLSNNKAIQKASEKASPVVDKVKPLLDAKNGKNNLPNINKGKSSSTGNVLNENKNPTKDMGNKSKQLNGVKDTEELDKPKTDMNDSGFKMGNLFDKNSIFNKNTSFEEKIKLFIKQHPETLLYIGGVLLFVLLLLFVYAIFANAASENTYSGSLVYTSCSEITIVTSGVQEVYSLEEYVAGVVYAEVGGFDDLVTYEVYSVAARTFAVNRTNECAKPIENSTNAQVFKKEGLENEKILEAVENTKGKVLKRDGEYISTQYDAFCYTEKNENGYHICQPKNGNFYIPEDWVNENASYYKDQLYPGCSACHGQGSSQYGTYYLSTVKGYTAGQILKYFYGDDIEFATLVSAYAGGEGLIEEPNTGFLMRRSRALRDNPFFYTGPSVDVDLKTGYMNVGGNEGECAWYAVRRTNEIISTMGLSDIYHYVNTGGNGGEFCYASDYAQFDKSYNVYDNNVIPGTVASYGNGGYGHVLVIENVNKSASGKITSFDVSEAYISSAKYPLRYNGKTYYTKNDIWDEVGDKSGLRKALCEANNKGCQVMSNYTPEELKGHGFICYIFINKRK